MFKKIKNNQEFLKSIKKKEKLKIGYYDSSELKKMGFKKVGKNVFLSKTINIVGLKNISFGNEIRIDSFCNIIANNGYLKIGNFVHISSYNFLACYKGIEFKDFTTTSPGVRIFSLTSDFTGEYFSNPTVKPKYSKTRNGKVVIEKYSIIGANSIILPGANIETGCAVGANSLINKSTRAWGIYVGNPAKRIKERSKKLLKFEKKIINLS